MKAQIWGIILLFCFVVSGCATMPVMKVETQDTFTIQSSFNKVWGALIATLSEQALPIKSIEKDSGLVTTDFFIFVDADSISIKEAFKKGSGAVSEKIDIIAYRPKVFLGIWTKGRYFLNIFVKSEGVNTTSIKITAHIEAFESNIKRSWLVCNSKGVIEKEIIDSIKAKL